MLNLLSFQNDFLYHFLSLPVFWAFRVNINFGVFDPFGIEQSTELQGLVKIGDSTNGIFGTCNINGFFYPFRTDFLCPYGHKLFLGERHRQVSKY